MKNLLTTRLEVDKYGKLCAYGDIRWVQYESFKFDFLKEAESKIKVVPENGFIKGNTLDGQFIYLHLGEPNWNGGLVKYCSLDQLENFDLENEWGVSTRNVRSSGGDVD